MFTVFVMAFLIRDCTVDYDEHCRTQDIGTILLMACVFVLAAQHSAKQMRKYRYLTQQAKLMYDVYIAYGVRPPLRPSSTLEAVHHDGPPGVRRQGRKRRDHGTPACAR